MSAYYAYDDTGRPGHLRLAATVAAAVVAVCVAFIIGYSVHGGHGTVSARSSAAAPPANPTRTPSGSTGPAASTKSAAAAPRGSLTRNSAGVIVGYSHDHEGAVAAAGNYTAALYVQNNRTHSRELAVLTSIAASSGDARRMAGDFSSEDAALAKLLDVDNLQTPGVIAYGHPLGYRIESVTGTAATIDVYVAGGQGMADAPSDSSATGETFYEVDQVELTWSPTAGPSRHVDWVMKNWSHLGLNNSPQLATVAAQGYLPFPIGQTSEGSSS